MLQQILRDGFIEPELLNELDEEQKQILFLKMREEQVRKYNEYEENYEKNEKKSKKIPPKPKNTNGKKTVAFLEGEDGEPWVWVMGEHENDKRIEDIIEEEAQKEALKLAEEEAEALRKKAEEEMQQKLKEEQEKLRKEHAEKQERLRKEVESAKIEAEKNALEKEKEQVEVKKRIQDVRRRDVNRSLSDEDIENHKKRRSSEIYLNFMKTKEKIEQQAKEYIAQVEAAWIEQEKKAKQADEEKREIARKARDEHRKSVGLLSPIAAVPENKEAPKNNKSTKVGGNAKPRAPKPPNREAVIKWFKEVEIPKGSGLVPDTKHVAVWFHGIISREEAEKLLKPQKEGSFLVRVSERVWGYAVSYRGPQKCKHFLIDTTNDNYQFFGINQVSHLTLDSLIKYYKTKPISHSGQELLQYPCQQVDDPPNYITLFPPENETSYL